MTTERKEAELTPRICSSLPGIENHEKFVNAAQKRLFIPEDQLDRLYIWWVTSAEVDKITQRFETAIVLEGIPELERNQAKKIFRRRKQEVSTIVKGINNFTNNQRARWGFAKPIVDTIETYENNQIFDEQVIALLEAISETQNVNSNEVDLRRKVAQHAWTELHRAAKYANLRFQAETDGTTTTLDDLETEKEELMGALKDELWTEEQVKQQKMIYRSMRALIRDYYPDEIAENLKVFWDTLRGKASRNTSAIEVLKASEYVLQYLDFEGAFEYYFEDIEEEE